MHSLYTRSNAIFSFAFSCLAAIAFAAFISSELLFSGSPKISLAVRDAQVENRQEFRHLRQKNDLGHVLFDLKADFASLFHWNTKQLFVYVVAEYATERNAFNQVVLWDKIILRGSENEFLNLENVRSKYPFFDNGEGLHNNRNITLSVHWNVIPNAGLLPRHSSGKIVFGFGNYFNAYIWYDVERDLGRVHIKLTNDFRLTLVWPSCADCY